MSAKQEKEQFEKQLPIIHERARLKFIGVDGYDVYNCSAPFIHNGKRCLYGRVEKREDWSNSRVMLFEETEKDVFKYVDKTVLYPLEDPFICKYNNEWLLGGVHVVKTFGDVKTYYCYFYRTEDINKPLYYTTGPDRMKDIRMVSLNDKLAVFTRPGDQVGYTEISGIEELSEEVLNNAELIDLIKDGGHGSVNQAIRLDSGLIAIIGHDSFSFPKENDWYSQHHVYFATASVFDPVTKKVLMNKILATRSCFVPDTPCKMLPSGIPMADIVFPSGILLREDGKIDLYAGVGDATAQRITLDNPFKDYGNLVFDW
jgi:hypothetical protein